MKKLLLVLPSYGLAFALAFTGTMGVFAPAFAAELVYFGSSACSVCETWDEEVGEIYPKTEEAKVLPLRHQDVHDDRPADLTFIKGVVYTPTFVAVENGKEVGRIIGYMGDFFFWEQVGSLLTKLNSASSQRVSINAPEPMGLPIPQ